MKSDTTILIVDDVSSNRETLRALLSNEAAQLLEAADGESAMRLAAEIRPDLILLDIMMPGMDGFEFCRMLRSEASLSAVPVLMVTALDDRASRLMGIDAGADDFITKPVDGAELILRVRNILRLNRFRQIVSERKRFEKLFELSPDGILILDSGGGVVLANSAFRRLAGLSSEAELDGLGIMGFIAPHQIAHCLKCMTALMEGSEESLKDETWFVSRDGRQFPVEIHAGRFEWEGRPAAQLLISDISERRLNARRLVDAIEAERKSLAYELHDEIGQLLTGLKMTLDQMPASGDGSLGCLQKEVELLVDRVRGLSLNLRPSMLDELGLLPALAAMFDRLAQSSGLEVDFKAVNAEQRLPAELETTAYRIVQEALSNVLRHSGVLKATVRLWLKDDLLGVQVEDRGRGFEPTAVSQSADSLGLWSIRDRVAGLGGDLQLNATPGAGVGVLVTLPVAGLSGNAEEGA